MNTALVVKLAILLAIIVFVALAIRWLLRRIGLVKPRRVRSRKEKILSLSGWILVGVGAAMGTGAFARAPLGDPWPMTIAALGTLAAGVIVLAVQATRRRARPRA